MQILEFGINLDPAPSLGKKVGKTISTGRKVEEKRYAALEYIIK